MEVICGNQINIFRLRYITPSVTLRVPPPSRREAFMHVARESTVVPEPVCGWHYIEINAYAESKCVLQNEYSFTHK